METTNKRTSKLKVISDPIYPDIEDIDVLRDQLKKLEVLGIIDIDFLFDSGIDIEYNADVLSPGIQIEGEKTLCLIGETKPSFKFGYGEDLNSFDIKDGSDNILIRIPIYSDLLELSLL